MDGWMGGNAASMQSQCTTRSSGPTTIQQRFAPARITVRYPAVIRQSYERERKEEGRKTIAPLEDIPSNLSAGTSDILRPDCTG